MTSTTSTARSRPTRARSRGGSGRAPAATPIHARRTRPSRISSLTTRRVVALTGTASPSPTPATAVLIPTTLPAAVDERAAGVARVQRGVGLDHVVDHAPGVAVADGQRAPERGHDARGHRAGEAVRVADRDHELADAQRRGVAQLGGVERGALGPQQREIGQRVGADELRRELAAVGERGHDARRAALADDVRVGEHEAVRRDDDARAAAAAADPQVGHRRRQRLRDERDHPRVAVEGLAVVGERAGRSHLLR